MASPDPSAMAAMAAMLIRAGGQELKVNVCLQRAVYSLMGYLLIPGVLKYVAVASMAVAIVDSIHCFPDEVNYVWFSDWSLIKILYLLSRYLMLVEIPVEIILTTSPTHTPSDCERYAYTGSLLAVFGVVVAEGILYIRAYALAGQSRKMAAFLVAVFIALNTSAVVFHLKYLAGIEFIPSPLPTLLPCFAEIRGKRQYSSNVFTFVLASEITILAITCWACFKTYRKSKSPLIVVCTRDGLFYFLLIAFTSIVNIIVNHVAPIRNMFAVAQRMMHGILSTRMVLRIRKAAIRRGPQVFDSDDTAMVPMSNMTGDSGTYHSGMAFAEGKSRKY